MAKRRRSEFRPDPKRISLPKLFYITQVQRDRMLKWGGYILSMILLLTMQDTILSRVRLFGATTDLMACVILLITVIEGVEVGSLFVVAASTLYYFSGSAPGPYCIGLLSFIGVAATLLRQAYLHRSKLSIVLCAGAALMCYEVGLYIVGVAQGLTRWDRIFSFLLTGGYSFALMIPLYDLINKIGLIGGNTWKE